MIKDALQFLIQLRDAAKPTIKIGYREYQNTGSGLQPILIPTSATMNFATLTGLIEWAKIHGIDDDKKPPYFVVQGPSVVRLYSKVFGPFEQRSVVGIAQHEECNFSSGHFMETEDFIVALQTQFGGSPDKAAILKLVGNVTEEDVKNSADDGITQTVTAKSGIVHLEDVKLPNPVHLCPFKTFPEIEVPEVPYVFRGRNGGPRWALYEGDGVLWEAEAMRRIADWIAEHSDYEVYA